MTGATRIELTHGALCVALAPSIGGAIVDARWGARDLLVTAPALARIASDPVAVLAMGCFPLVPYANRINRGQFMADGQPITLPPNMTVADPVHPLHGLGWLAAWDVADQTPASVTLRWQHGGAARSGWPWPLSAEQHIRLTDTGLEVRLAVRNDGDRPMPAGLGLHPRFPGGARITARVTGRWDGAPGAIPQRWRTGGDVAADMAALTDGDVIDHCYTGRTGVVRLDWDDWAVDIAPTPNLDLLHVYQPTHSRWLCVEPVSHRPDAINAPPGEAGAMRWLVPGESMAAGMVITPA